MVGSLGKIQQEISSQASRFVLHAKMIPISPSRRNGQFVALKAVLEVIENREFLTGHHIRRRASLDATPDGGERGLEDG